MSVLFTISEHIPSFSDGFYLADSQHLDSKSLHLFASHQPVFYVFSIYHRIKAVIFLALLLVHPFPLFYDVIFKHIFYRLHSNVY